MPDSFFASAKVRKRKRPQHQNGVKKPSKKAKLDEELSQHSDSDNNANDWADLDLRAEEPDPNASGDSDTDETPAEKRLRLAQLYLSSVKESLAAGEGDFDAAEIDRDIISSRLKQDVLSHSGKIHLFVADSYSSCLSTKPPTLRTRGHRFSVTSAVTSSSSRYLFTAGKEGAIIKWDLTTGKKVATVHKCRIHDSSTTTPSSSTATKKKNKGKWKAQAIEVQGHTDEILTLALSSDGKYLASGGRDRRLIVWDAESLSCIKVFQGPMNHKDTISALSFKHSTHTLYTASFDRTLKLYDLSPSILGYTETLFGHQDSVLSISSLSGDNCVSVGGRDKTARYWKIVDESQEEKGKEKEKGEYVEGSLECIAMIDESTFVTGGDSGSISLWSTTKKKPIFTHPLAHGLHSTFSSTEGTIQTPRWITSLATLPYSDLFVSGSWEGQIRLWKVDSKLKSFSLLGNLPIPGIINSLQLVSPPKSFFTSLTSSSKTPNSASNPFNASTDTTAAASLHTTSTPSVPNSASLPNTSESTWLPRSLLSQPHTRTAPVIFLIAGTGQEHRFGRWLTVKEGGAVNGCYVVALLPDSAAGDAAEEDGGEGTGGLRTF
ncbi:hypothetical protein NP233_g12172 [Leucocoprinus birnbaumii]|uniref:WD40 repeat-like protein n=1 Tax=Leucocoprinus birnbaumii TaxID=56174 RepID=A0AAD5VFG2_9AGAR|nr:hypothetical protein NP233_g12172 [Leucocoprinus birnbaumii]